jgi:hypothetical protein
MRLPGTDQILAEGIEVPVDGLEVELGLPDARR